MVEVQVFARDDTHSPLLAFQRNVSSPELCDILCVIEQEL